MLPDAPRFEPPSCVQRRADPRPFDTERLRPYRQIAERFETARSWAYVPPISVWDVAPSAFDGSLASYLRVMQQAAKHFDRLIDFSLPSRLTAQTAQTYDGEHYREPVQQRIAQTLRGEGQSDFGIDVASPDYAQRYREQLADWIRRLQIEAGPPLKAEKGRR